MQTFPLSPSRDREFVRHEIRRRHLTVLDRTALTDTLVRFRLGGSDLAGFTSVGPEDHVRVFFAAADSNTTRDYTPSEFRPTGASGGPELDLDMVVHGDTGPASAWASRARPGDLLEVGGPRGSRLAPSGYRSVLLVADPTGLPALRRWLHAYAGTVPVRVVFFGTDHTIARCLDADETRAADRIEVVTDRAALADAVRRQGVDDDTFVWAAGEATALIPVRRLLKGDAGLDRERRSLHGYWREGDAALGDHAVIDPADPD